MLPIATRDYLRFGVLQSLSLFKAMTRYPTLERLPHLQVPTLVVAGSRDPLLRQDRIHVLERAPPRRGRAHPRRPRPQLQPPTGASPT